MPTIGRRRARLHLTSIIFHYQYILSNNKQKHEKRITEGRRTWPMSIGSVWEKGGLYAEIVGAVKNADLSKEQQKANSIRMFFFKIFPLFCLKRSYKNE